MTMRQKVQAGEIPERPSDGITDSFWNLLEECWSKIPAKRPPVLKLCEAMLNAVTEDLPEKLCLHFLYITPTREAVIPKLEPLYLKIKYGEMTYETLPMMHAPLRGSEAGMLTYVYAHFCPLPCS